MDADYTVELGRDDPVLDFPWTDPEGKVAYRNVKGDPGLLPQIPEAVAHPELGEFLRAVNSRRSVVESAKCDAWSSGELSADEEVFGGGHKAASYVDLVFSNIDDRRSFDRHEQFLKGLVKLLWKTPETRSSAEFCLRRCYFDREGQSEEGLYITAYVNGYGLDMAQARQNWGIALRLVANALAQLSAAGGT